MSYIRHSHWILDVLAIVISVIALCFSWQTYKDHQHQLLEDKQIDAVVDLVSYIQDCTLSVLFTPEPLDMDKIREYKTLNIFELADTTIRKDMDSSPIFFPTREKMPFDFTPYVCNPLIPSEIAKKLYDYCIIGVQYRSKSEAVMSSNVIITKFTKPERMLPSELAFEDNIERKYGLKEYYNDIEDQFLSMSKVPAYSSFGKFKKNNLELYNIIISWFHNKGMNNVNIPMDSRLYEKRDSL